VISYAYSRNNFDYQGGVGGYIVSYFAGIPFTIGASAAPAIEIPTDAIVKITKTTICGTDLHIMKGDVSTVTEGRLLGHEGVGIIDQIGASDQIGILVRTRYQSILRFH